MMKTIIVYVVISGEADTYFEQVWASAWSLKHYNPHAHVLLLTDDATKQTIHSDARKESLNYIDEIVTVEFDRDYSNKEKSRWIKTNMRKLISGDFLFIDADTIICGDLSDVDNWTCSIGAVLDSHCHSKEICDTIVFKDMYIDRLKRIFDVDYQGEDVFNSGVMFVKDDEKAHRFFDTWHNNWQHSNTKGIVLDQLPLLKTNMELGQVIEGLPGEYDCQVRFSIQYLTKAKILHTFATQERSELSVLLGPDIYDEIKKAQRITENIDHLLLNCKETFTSPSYLLAKKWMKLRFQPTYFFIESALESDKHWDQIVLKCFNFLSRCAMFIHRKLY